MATVFIGRVRDRPREEGDEKANQFCTLPSKKRASLIDTGLLIVVIVIDIGLLPNIIITSLHTKGIVEIRTLFSLLFGLIRSFSQLANSTARYHNNEIQMGIDCWFSSTKE